MSACPAPGMGSLPACPPTAMMTRSADQERPSSAAMECGPVKRTGPGGASQCSPAGPVLAPARVARGVMAERCSWPGRRLLARDGRGGSRGRAQPGGGGCTGATALILADQVDDGVDQGQVGKGLREVPEMTPGMRVDLLGVQEQRAGVGEQFFAQRPGAGYLSNLGQRGDQPERANRERTFLA